MEAQTSKVRQCRPVYPKPEAMALLKAVLPKGRLPLHPQSRRRAIRGLREALGWKVWPKDITRHTAASMWLADCQSTAAVARSLGNSESILLRDYAALVTKEQAAKFWNMVNEWKV